MNSLCYAAADMDFMPHGHCFLWREDLLALHVGGDVLTALSYFFIPAALVRVIRGHRDLEFGWIVAMFAGFILFCGATHLVTAVNVWRGHYYVEGWLKLATAAISLATAYQIQRLVPKALAMPTHATMREMHQQLADANSQLEASNRNLEQKVLDRTRELEQLATTDPLTQVGNRRALMERLASEAARSARHRRPLSVLMIDVDDFKAVNDQHGHEAGDRTLQAVAQGACAGRVSSDFVGRLGGEEFVVILPETTLDGGGRAGERLRRAIAEATQEAPGAIAVTCSVGVAQLRHGEDVADALRRADDALYEAKRGGKNKVVMRDI